MITVQALFFKRLKNEWAFQYRVWKMAVDWIVAMYIVIPALIVCFGYYLSWWHKLPGWSQVIPLPLVFSAAFLFVNLGTVRLFIEDADQLFLLQRSLWVNRLMRYGIGYTAFAFLMSTVVCGAIVLPLLLYRFQWPVWQVSAFFLFCYCCKLNQAFVKQFLGLRYYGIIARILVFVGLYALSGFLFVAAAMSFYDRPLFLLLVSVLLCLTLAQLIKKRIRTISSFSADVRREQELKLKYCAFLLGWVGAAEKKKRFVMRKPLLFRKSTPIFKKRSGVNVLVELAFKSYFRKWSQVKFYLLFMFYSIVVVVSVPFWLKVIVWLLLAFLLAAWMKTYWQEIRASAYLRMFQWKDADMLAAAKKSVFMLALPGFFIVSLTFGLFALPWWGTILLLPVSVGVVYAAAAIMHKNQIYLSRQK